jgi:hypothetical protein
MSGEPSNTQISPVVPFLHYADLEAASEWLPRVFDLTLRSIERGRRGNR